MKKVVAYLSLNLDIDFSDKDREDYLWKLTSPEILWLPWPAENIPEIGSIITNGKLPYGYDHLEVEEFEYDLASSSEDEIRLEITVKPVHGNNAENLLEKIGIIKFLNYFAEQGFIFAIDKIPIKKVLDDPHLYQIDTNTKG